MLRFDKIFKEERMLRGLTSLNLVEFETLYPGPTHEEFSLQHQTNVKRTLNFFS
jgi:hypothetical protein